MKDNKFTMSLRRRLVSINTEIEDLIYDDQFEVIEDSGYPEKNVEEMRQYLEATLEGLQNLIATFDEMAEFDYNRKSEEVSDSVKQES